MASQRAIVYGGRGGLGNVIVDHFKGKGWWICSVDIHPNDAADLNVLVDPKLSWTEQEEFVLKNVTDNLNGSQVEAIINMAGKFLHALLRWTY